MTFIFSNYGYILEVAMAEWENWVNGDYWVNLLLLVREL